jgi:predicted TIM-barrel fold metal-dependent hydrolase
VIFDTYVALPADEGAAAPDPSVARLFSAQSSAYATGGTLDDIIRDYDEHGVDYGLLAKVPRDITPPFVPAMQLDDDAVHATCQAVATAVSAYPDRFLGAVGLDPKLGYQAARHVRIAVEEYGIRAIRILPMWTGIPIDDPLGYPLYTAACDLGVPVCINVGVPGPMKPARLQRTILVDEVALCFPDLPIVMSHVGDPWVDETISMLVKHPNVYLMTAGFAPKYLPDPLVRYLDSRGREKVMWSSYFPIMTVERTLREGKELPLRPEAMSGYLGENAARVFGTPGGG